jgi:hypothetical protein
MRFPCCRGTLTAAPVRVPDVRTDRAASPSDHVNALILRETLDIGEPNRMERPERFYTDLLVEHGALDGLHLPADLRWVAVRRSVDCTTVTNVPLLEPCARPCRK